MERDAVGLVVRHVVRQLRRQHERHIVSDVIVRAVLRGALAIAVGIVDVLDLLLKGRLLRVLHAAGQRRLVRRRFQLVHGDLAGHHVAGQPGQHSSAVLAVPCNSMVRRHREGDGRGGQVALRRLGLRQHIGAVIQALEFEGIAFGVDHPGLDDLAVLVQLLQLERCAVQGCALLGHLADIHLVGEHDHGVLGSLILVFDGLAFSVHARGVAVGQIRGVDVALRADIRCIPQLGIEGQNHLCAVQRIDDLVPGPGQRLGEAFAGRRGDVGQLISDVHAGQGGLEAAGFAELACLKGVVEGDVVLLIVRHVVRQRRGQPEFHIIANVIVRAVIPCLAIHHFGLG